jgi:hypothetical protein
MTKIQVMIFWVVTLCSDVGYHPEDGGSMILRNVYVLPHHYMLSQPRRLHLDVEGVSLFPPSLIPLCKHECPLPW